MKEVVRRENTLSATADDGWMSTICLTHADHLGRSSEFILHQSMSLTDPISIHLAMYAGSSYFRPESVSSLLRKGMMERESISVAVGCRIWTLCGENSCAALKQLGSPAGLCAVVCQNSLNQVVHTYGNRLLTAFLVVVPLSLGFLSPHQYSACTLHELQLGSFESLHSTKRPRAHLPQVNRFQKRSVFHSLLPEASSI